MQLTKTQRIAVESFGKNILVSAGAGTGKTRVLVERFLHFVTDGQVPVTEILALTFTDKAANEMKSRIHSRLRDMGLDLVRRDLESAYISTIHAFAARLLKEHPVEAGVDPGFRVIKQEEADLVKEQAIDEALEKLCEPASGTFRLLRVYGENAVREGLSKVLETARQEGETLEAFFETEKLSCPWREKFQELALVFEGLYELRKKEAGVLDFEDLQLKALGLFKKTGMVHQKLLERYRKKFRLILVDEFQDTSPLQLKLIEMLSSGDNLFLVGDYKQSIYAFRGAEAGVFLAKEREYADSKTGLCLPLLENFRTEKPALDFINRFFRNLWKEDGLPFEDLIPTVEESGKASVELLVTSQNEEESLDHARLREASGLAHRIRELHEEEGIPYGDMAILFQAMRPAPVYEQALKKEGVPYFVVAGRGFYHQPEIRDMMSFLAHLENPLSDIPLAAVLRSPFFQISDGTLFWLARYAKKDNAWKPLYEGLQSFETIEEISEPEKERLRFFVSVTAELRRLKDKLRITELLEAVFSKTSYELRVLRDPQGIRRYANLKKLISLAREYESREMLSIGSFLRLIRRLETQEIKESEAQVEAEKSGRVVRLLTIHRAKGLEFRVVFVADLGRQGQGSEAGMVIAQAGKGYALKMFNEETLKWEKPLSWKEMEEGIKRKENEEWKRLFYVALTRAKSKLILSGVWKEKKTARKSYHDMSSWMEWVMKTPPEILEGMKVTKIKQVPGGRPNLALAEKNIFKERFPSFEVQAEAVIKKSSKTEKQIILKAEGILKGLEGKEKITPKTIDLPVSAYAAYQKSPETYKRIYEIGYPNWLTGDHEREFEGEEEEISRADFGTAMHRLLERLDFKDPQGNVDTLLKECFRGMDEGKREEARKIAEDFFKTPLFDRLSRAKMLRRELPFILNERHGVIHGVIDLLFKETDGSWHVVDYKTAVGTSEKVKEAGYDLQIAVYAAAVKELLNESPRSGILYFLKNQWEYRVDFNEKRLDEAGENIRQMQDAIINFRNQSVECAR
ncbi:MAG TPA: UvrD-helicase domain-containing protein [bacterium]|nr:UvrD-helicase domain-containing protein [bacterium]